MVCYFFKLKLVKGCRANSSFQLKSLHTCCGYGFVLGCTALKPPKKAGGDVACGGLLYAVTYILIISSFIGALSPVNPKRFLSGMNILIEWREQYTITHKKRENSTRKKRPQTRAGQSQSKILF